MNSNPKLNFPSINLHAKEDNGRILVFDSIRKQYVVLTPEEWVRRHLVEYLIEHCGATPQLIVEEYPVNINSTPQRADVVVMNNHTQPLILAECKATEIDFNNKQVVAEVFGQATRYNAVVRARYIILTNGLKHFCFELCDGTYKALQAFPRLDK